MLLNYNFNKILSPQIFLLFLLFLVSCDTQVNTEGTTASADTEDNVTIIADADQDGIADVNDSCPLSQVIGDTDYDGDGCFNSEDTDDDNDGVDDENDSCPKGLLSWISDESTDFDSDGCNDATEDDDDDDDGVTDLNDTLCPKTDLTKDSYVDSDNDGCDNENDDDDDNDGIKDTNDICNDQYATLNWISDANTDYDGDGCNDFNEDEDIDNDGILNWGKDGIKDTIDDDACLKGATKWTSNSDPLKGTVTDHDGDGCKDSSEDLDDDNDSFLDAGLDGVLGTFDDDLCPRGFKFWVPDSNNDYDNDGCLDDNEDDDDDNDGKIDYDSDGKQLDLCSKKEAGKISWISNKDSDYDADGCEDKSEDDDDDNDNIDDVNDLCDPESGILSILNWESDSMTDSDGDGCQDSSEDLDDDNDSLKDQEEIEKYSTSPIKSDTDGDGLSDGDEVNIYSTNPLETDTDGDGLSDGIEIRDYSTDPLSKDTDGDELSDFEEIKTYLTNPLNSDSDNDKIEDADEINIYLTDPLKKDTDGDGFSDSDDNCPLISNNQSDYDNDGLGDVCDPDDDNDKREDTNDFCDPESNIDSQIEWDSTDINLDHDGDGCKDLSEDLDDDNDGVNDKNDSGDILDQCPSGETGWTSNSDPTKGLVTDYDGDGCLDKEITVSGEVLQEEDDDDDNDNRIDTEDNCDPDEEEPGDKDNGEDFSEKGWDSTDTNNDYDQDGCEDSQYNGEDLDDDNDGVFNDLDKCDLDSQDGSPEVQWISNNSMEKGEITDYDLDGCKDETEDDDDDNDSRMDSEDKCDPDDNNTPLTDRGLNWSEKNWNSLETSYDWDEDGCLDNDIIDGSIITHKEEDRDDDGNGKPELFIMLDDCTGSFPDPSYKAVEGSYTKDDTEYVSFDFKTSSLVYIEHETLVDLLIVGGGGAGGAGNGRSFFSPFSLGGGGGGGEVVEVENIRLSKGFYSFEIGAGGIAYSFKGDWFSHIVNTDKEYNICDNPFSNTYRLNVKYQAESSQIFYNENECIFDSESEEKLIEAKSGGSGGEDMSSSKVKKGANGGGAFAGRFEDKLDGGTGSSTDPNDFQLDFLNPLEKNLIKVSSGNSGGDAFGIVFSDNCKGFYISGGGGGGAGASATVIENTQICDDSHVAIEYLSGGVNCAGGSGITNDYINGDEETYGSGGGGSRNTSATDSYNFMTFIVWKTIQEEKGVYSLYDENCKGGTGAGEGSPTEASYTKYADNVDKTGLIYSATSAMNAEENFGGGGGGGGILSGIKNLKYTKYIEDITSCPEIPDNACVGLGDENSDYCRANFPVSRGGNGGSGRIVLRVKKDCAQKWGGVSYLDDCEVCDSNSFNDNKYCMNYIKSNFDPLNKDFSNSIFTSTSVENANLKDAIFQNADLSNANLSDADLSGADLSNANLSDADLSGADLSGADLSGADLTDTNLSNTDLTDAKFQEANLKNTILNNSKMDGAALGSANIDIITTTLVSCPLSVAENYVCTGNSLSRIEQTEE
ncbi:MAG: hypothetical protein CMP11_05425 [Zetaproteobacteria bacterium]|nr:hypothetical protein [Pseudobdellovibrionaceae bacterium]